MVINQKRIMNVSKLKGLELGKQIRIVICVFRILWLLRSIVG